MHLRPSDFRSCTTRPEKAQSVLQTFSPATVVHACVVNDICAAEQPSFVQNVPWRPGVAVALTAGIVVAEFSFHCTGAWRTLRSMFSDALCHAPCDPFLRFLLCCKCLVCQEAESRVPPLQPGSFLLPDAVQKMHEPATHLFRALWQSAWTPGSCSVFAL